MGYALFIVFVCGFIVVYFAAILIVTVTVKVTIKVD